MAQSESRCGGAFGTWFSSLRAGSGGAVERRHIAAGDIDHVERPYNVIH
jgi:hypothetical protein